MRFTFIQILLILIAFILPNQAQAFDDDVNACLLEKIKTENPTITLKELKALCINDESELVIKHNKKDKPEALLSANPNQNNKAVEPYVMTPYVMTPHRMNYLLPINYSDNRNREVYESESNWASSLSDIEIKYQISFRVPLLTESIFTEGDGLAFAFTLQSWWQVYERDISRPFRETNYRPELFYYTPIQWQPLGGNTALLMGFEHQSNGYARDLSRSWNRVYAEFLFAKDNYLISFRPWWRIPEGDKVTTPTEPGDDNPDITDYMGHFELSMVYEWENYDLFFKGRRNFKEQNGGMELGVTFPLIGRLKGYIQYTNGYGESLIDYNHSQKTFGIGVALTDYFTD